MSNINRMALRQTLLARALGPFRPGRTGRRTMRHPDYNLSGASRFMLVSFLRHLRYREEG